jgi:SMP-30/Gluconolactonase/LRE-like region
MSFLTYLRRDLEQIFFKDRDPHAIPSMDGAFSPNDRLERTTPIGDPLPGADAVAEGPDGSICVSAGNKVWRLSGAGYANRSMFHEFDAEVGALAFHPDGRLLACTARGLAAIDRAGRTALLADAEGEALNSLTAVAAAPDGTIFVSDGSTRHPAADWCVDLMELNALGRIVSCRAALDGARVLRRGLNYPGGLAVAPDGYLWFAESFGHSLSRARITAPGSIGPSETVIRNMPGYPSRLAPAAGGGFWLSLFGVRTHLVEFVLKEDDFRHEMMRTIPPPYWIAPIISSTRDCLEPLQLGGLRALGVEKPWAPPRSYGLLARVDADGEVIETLHSRVGGKNHGITDAIETAQGVVIVSKGSGRVLLQQAGAQQ